MKYIIITGGVLSGIGKGITGASLGALLEASGYRVWMQKLDGYLNIDASQINPQQHGENFITYDGAVTDLDIGHYERFIERELGADASYTMGRIYQEILIQERNGIFSGRDVQMIPHVSDLIISKIKQGYHDNKADIAIIEIGGTVGDIENEILIEATRELRSQLGPEQVLFAHMVYLPYLEASQELKTKPAQNALKDLRSRGITPDLLFVRADKPIDDQIRHKLSTMTGIAYDHTIPVPTLTSIYQLPCYFHTFNIVQHIANQLTLPAHRYTIDPWQKLSQTISADYPAINITLLGEYLDTGDTYYSLKEALRIAAWHAQRQARISVLTPTSENSATVLETSDLICASYSTGYKHKVCKDIAKYAQQYFIPYLGTAGGAYMLLDDITPSLDPLSYRGNQQISTHDLDIYPQTNTQERYRHKSELDVSYTSDLNKLGYRTLANNPSTNTIDAWISQDGQRIGTIFHPELTSRPLQSHPLFDYMIRQAIAKQSNSS